MRCSLSTSAVGHQQGCRSDLCTHQLLLHPLPPLPFRQLRGHSSVRPAAQRCTAQSSLPQSRSWCAGHQAIAPCHLRSVESPESLPTAALVHENRTFWPRHNDPRRGCAFGCFSLAASWQLSSDMVVYRMAALLTALWVSEVCDWSAANLLAWEQQMALKLDCWCRPSAPECGSVLPVAELRSIHAKFESGESGEITALQPLMEDNVQPVSWNVPHRIFDLLSLELAHSTEPHVEAVWKKIGRAFRKGPWQNLPEAPAAKLTKLVSLETPSFTPKRTKVCTSGFNSQTNVY